MPTVHLTNQLKQFFLPVNRNILPWLPLLCGILSEMVECTPFSTPEVANTYKSLLKTINTCYAIWFNKDVTVERFKTIGKGTMAEYIGIEWVELGDNFIKAKMPVDHRTKQPMVYCMAAHPVFWRKQLAVWLPHLVIDHSKFVCVGIEINANHVRSAREGFVNGTCISLASGSSTHVWDIRI